MYPYYAGIFTVTTKRPQKHECPQEDQQDGPLGPVQIADLQSKEPTE